MSFALIVLNSAAGQSRAWSPSMLNLYFHSVHRAVEQLARHLGDLTRSQPALADPPVTWIPARAPVPVVAIARITPRRVPRSNLG
jgi:hypothetical protein